MYLIENESKIKTLSDKQNLQNSWTIDVHDRKHQCLSTQIHVNRDAVTDILIVKIEVTVIRMPHEVQYL